MHNELALSTAPPFIVGELITPEFPSLLPPQLTAGGVVVLFAVKFLFKEDEEWFELLSVTPSLGPSSPIVTTLDFDVNAAPNSTDNKQEPERKESPSHCNADETIQSDPAADIEILEQSLISLLDDFRSGRMNALSEERLKQMRKARKDMEELTAFHVKLHRQQVPNLLSPAYV
ncbi:unnamed protein product [Toxocara canis]|uniref:Uncharacterized protein n=1 Tax=Toxocara canis TaxID=6265 RepID=A0A183V8E9_TOXCA|nr:unnamed protein product [Toxocara canis]